MSDIVCPIQTLAGVGEIVRDGAGKVIMLMESRGLSHPVTDWETYFFVVPAVEVDGVGAVGEPLPPTAVPYHFKDVPDAERGVALTF